MRKQKTKVVVGEVNAPQGRLLNQRAKRFMTRKNVLIGGCIGLLVLIVAVVFTLLPNDSNRATGPKGDQLTTLELNKEVSGLVQGYKLAEAEKVMKSQAATKENLSGFLSLASVQSGQSKYTEALKTLQEAEAKFGKSYTLAMQTAQMYIQKGDHAKSLEQYREALRLLQADPKQVSNAKDATANLQQIITALEKVKP